ncbi:alcohol dehydrogenase catalytic domain-containing protein [Devosia sp. PTR5]|uniref:Alcohol dehydrogenase catalytic domain-containing protein n=2 Tax=Devosia oryzisoli TaxID=2774138 RepID=A0A927FW45_9HYPH|nr:alcohol dehydrogenase catalytic domain-containing protein [Devosia oryzisoli]
MLAVVKTGPGPENVLVQPMPVPEAGEGMTRVRVLAAGICGTDVHIARDEYRYEAPVILGHEILGMAEAADAEPQRVTVETYFSTCGRCDWCRDGRPNLCPSRRSIGSFENGGFASYVVVPAHNLHPLPDFLDDIEGVLSEPLACVTHCLLDPPVVSAGDRVLVTGPGTIGQLAAQVARAAGGLVTLAGLPKDSSRLDIARSLGIETTTGLPEAEAFDVVVECSGSAPGAAAALRAARRGGRYVQVGIFGKDVTLPIDLVLYKELVVTSGFASTPSSWRRALALIEQKLVTLSPLVTRRADIRDWPSAFEAAASGEGLKTVIVPE